jgi:hypothetical protein
MEQEELMANTDQATGRGTGGMLSGFAGIISLLSLFLRRLVGFPNRLPTPIEHVIVLMYETAPLITCWASCRMAMG